LQKIQWRKKASSVTNEAPSMTIDDVRNAVSQMLESMPIHQLEHLISEDKKKSSIAAANCVSFFSTWLAYRKEKG
jgi:hypothetical protein